MVISVNAWMNHPGGFHLRDGKVVDVHPFTALFANSYLWHELIHMYIAGYIVAGFLVAGAYAFGRLRGRWGRYERTALAIPLTIAALASPVQVLVGDWAARDVATKQPVKLAAIEGLYKTTKGAGEHVLGWYTDDQVKYGIEIPHLLSLLSFHSWNATVKGLDSVPAQRTSAGERGADGVPDDGRDRHAARAARRLLRRRLATPAAASGIALVLRRGGARGPLVGGRADLRVGRDRGRPPALGRLPRDAHRGRRDRRERDPRRATALLAAGYVVIVGGLAWVLRRLARAPLEQPLDPPGPRRSPPDVLQALPMIFVLIGLALYTVLGGADFGAGFWRSRRRARDRAPSASASTPTTRWGRCGRPTTCG